MTKRASDLTIGELAAMGAKAARAAMRTAQEAGLAVTGVVKTYEDGEPTSRLAVRQPSGTVTLVHKGSPRPTSARRPGRKPHLTKAPD